MPLKLQYQVCFSYSKLCTGYSDIYTNCDNQPRFEECWVRSGIQHEKQSLENLFEKILYVCAHVAKETPLSPGLGTKQKDLLNKYFQVEIDRRMVDFIVGLDSEMQQLVDACSKTGGLKQRTLNFWRDRWVVAVCFYKNLRAHSRSFCKESRGL